MTDMSKTWGSMTEAQLQSTVIEIMRWKGWSCYHTHDSRRSEPGYPDLTAVRDSRLMFVEFKTEKGRMRPAQIEWLNMLVQAHGEVYLVRPSTMDAFLKNMEHVGDDLSTHWRNVRQADE